MSPPAVAHYLYRRERHQCNRAHIFALRTYRHKQPVIGESECLCPVSTQTKSNQGKRNRAEQCYPENETGHPLESHVGRYRSVPEKECDREHK